MPKIDLIRLSLNAALVVTALIPVLIALSSPLLAQSDTMRPIMRVDSVERARDSTLNEAYLRLGVDSTLVDEYHKIIQIHKARSQSDRQLKAAERMVYTVPTSALGWFLLGDAQLDNSYPERAIPPLKRALSLSPTFVRARLTLAESYSALKTYDSALSQLDTALRDNPRNADAHMRRAALLEKMGRWQETVDNYRAASELLPERFEPWMKLAQTLFKAGRFDESVATSLYVTKLSPDSASALILLADAQAASGRSDDALISYQQFIYRFPKHPRALEAERIARELGWRP